MSLFNTICATPVPSLLSASVDTFSTVLARSSQSPYNVLLAVCASTDSVCGIVLRSRNMTPAVLFSAEAHVAEPELSVRILKLVESIIEKLSVHHLTSEKSLGTNLDSFICYMIAVTSYVLFNMGTYLYSAPLDARLINLNFVNSRHLHCSTEYCRTSCNGDSDTCGQHLDQWPACYRK